MKICQEIIKSELCHREAISDLKRVYTEFHQVNKCCELSYYAQHWAHSETQAKSESEILLPS
jgi:hypothetical protein